MSRDIVTQLMQEAQAYRQFEDIERLVESGIDLAVLPLQPLYLALRGTSQEQVAHILPRLSLEQRQAMMDIDMWKRDEVDPTASNWWLQAYALCPETEVRSAFAHSEEFLLLVKSQCEVATFDAEDPQYPDHDNYFLTEDNQLWIAFPEDFAYAQELRQLIKDLYTEMGPEHAYAHLFKMVSDSYMILEEESFRLKNDRLRDFGFVDYYEAQEMDAVFPSIQATTDWVMKRMSPTGEVDAVMKNQALHASALTPYQGGLESLRAALENIADEARRDFLHFNFIRLVNARIAGEDALKKGSTALGRAGGRTRQRLELGFSFCAHLLGESKVFEKLDFIDVYRVGNSLLESQKRTIKKALNTHKLEEDESFLGGVWQSFVEASFDEPIKLKVDGSTSGQEVRSQEVFRAWETYSQTFIQALPFVVQVRKTLHKLRDDHALSNSFYLNYAIDDIDFEAIMLSSLINFTLGNFERSDANKMGVKIEELKAFYRRHFIPREGEWLLREDESLQTAVKGFVEKFGLSTVPGFDRWLIQTMVEQLNGYDIENMAEEEFRHVGGPVLLITAAQ